MGLFSRFWPPTLLGRGFESREAFEKNTYCGIIPVDFAGYPVNMEAFKELADEFGLWIIEDACHAPGGYFIDRHEQRQGCGNGKFCDRSKSPQRRQSGKTDVRCADVGYHRR